MKRRIQQRAQFLLVLFALGGVLAPVAHRVHHLATRAEAPARESLAKSQGGLLMERAAQDASCLLCAFLLTADFEAEVLTVWAHVKRIDVPVPASLASPAVPTGQSRAPPALA